jgi:hypothetical protein
MSAIQSPKMPGGLRPQSPVAQIAAMGHQDPEVDEVAGPPAAVKQHEPKPDKAKAEEKPQQTAAVTAGGSGRRGAAKRGGAAASPLKSAVRKPLLLNLDEDLKQRMVNTVVWTGPRTGLRNQQAFIRRAITELCEKFELEHNHGKPFDVVEDAAEA